MKIEILSIFPDIFAGFIKTSLVGKAVSRGLIRIDTLDIRSFAEPPHMKVDDEPYGGGAGMVLKPEPLAMAIKDAKSRLPDAKVILLTPSGIPFKQSTASDLSSFSEIVFICGRYEGVDQRIVDKYVDLELSIGDYVLMGGEVAAMVVIEAVLRLKEDVIGNISSLQQESFAGPNNKFLEGPQYTRPAEFEGRKVPEVLLSGDHQAIKNWRASQSELKTKSNRPDLIKE